MTFLVLTKFLQGVDKLVVMLEEDRMKLEEENDYVPLFIDKAHGVVVFAWEEKEKLARELFQVQATYREQIASLQSQLESALGEVALYKINAAEKEVNEATWPPTYVRWKKKWRICGRRKLIALHA